MTDFSKYPNFKKEAFEDGGPEMHPEFMRKLQLARWIAWSLCKERGYPESYAWFVISSGSRSESKNRQVGGKPDSTHLYGRACDIKAGSSRARFIIVKSLLLAGFTRIGLGDNFVHVDDGEYLSEVDKAKDVMWLY